MIYCTRLALKMNKSTKQRKSKTIAKQKIKDTIAYEKQPENLNKFKYQTEGYCRMYMEELFGVPFNKTRPKFLKNPYTKGTLELDMYNSNLKLAVEYNGQQHYDCCHYFHKNGKRDFIKLKTRDNLKMKLCEKYGVKLIIVSYEIKLENIRKYLLKELKQLKL